MKRIILKVSGEALGDANLSKGIDIAKVNETANEILKLLNSGEYQLGIIVGGGNIWRGRDAHLSGMDRTHADYMGMMATVLNARALASSLNKLGVKAKVLSSFATPISEKYSKELALDLFKQGYVLFFAGGIGLPFFSTDTCAALRALELSADVILMAKNGTDGVYDKDPRTNKNAKKFDHITYNEIIENKLGVMDLTAATLCIESGVNIVVFDMNVKGNIALAAHDSSIGTLITK